MLAILVMTVVGCELFDSERWARIKREDAERGRTCYRDRYGNFYCKDTKQENYELINGCIYEKNMSEKI